MNRYTLPLLALFLAFSFSGAEPASAQYVPYYGYGHYHYRAPYYAHPRARYYGYPAYYNSKRTVVVYR